MRLKIPVVIVSLFAILSSCSKTMDDARKQIAETEKAGNMSGIKLIRA